MFAGPVAFLRIAPTGVVDEDLPHDPGAQTPEVGAVLDVGDALIHHSQVHFVHQRGRLQWRRGLALQLDAGELSQLVVDGRQQRVHRDRFAGAVALQQLGERRFHHVMQSESDAEHTHDDRFDRLSRTFEELRTLRPEARALRLERLEADDPELAAAVRPLLAHHSDDPDELGSPERAFAADELQRALADVGTTPPVPDRIGPYLVQRRLGQGGMGDVFLAVHEDPDLRRDVAVKVLHTTRLDADSLRRFRVERRILGALQHANIAALFDGGSTEQGWPYVVMEFVDGDDLLRHCAERRLPLERRLELFVRVCRAVAHAHRALVVHRDLKPGNVLVTRDGEPKLLDFGIAKLLDDELAPAADTRTGNALLTPEYCSPEQVRGEPVTTGTDVFALGVLLYELLTGHRPHTGATVPAVLDAVCERTPEAPSVVVRGADGPPRGAPETRTRLVRRIEGDLDTIVLTALRKEPERRYVSAEAFADDVERFGRGLPIRARPDTIGYRTRKFIARNRVPVGIAALAAGMLVAFVGFVLHSNVTVREQLDTIGRQNLTIAAERDEARNQREVAARVVEFMVSLYEMASPDPTRARTLRARELLDLGARRIGSELAGVPAQQAPLQVAMGAAYQSLGMYDEAEPLLVAAERTFGELRPDSRQHRDAQYLLAGVLLRRARPEQGERMMRRSIAPSVDPLPAAVRAARLTGWATWLRQLGRFDEALATVEEARTLAVDARPEDMALAPDFDVVEAAIRRERGETRRARELAVAGLARLEARDGENDPRHAFVWKELADIERDLGNLDAARKAIERTLQIDRARCGDEHPDVDDALFVLAMITIDAQQWHDAERHLEELLERDVARFGERHPYPAVLRGQLASVHSHLGKDEQAAAGFALAAEILREAGAEADALELATVCANEASWLLRQRRPVDAIPKLQEALRLRETLLPEEHPAMLTVRNQLAVAELDRGNAAGAEPEFRKVLELRRRVRGEHPEVAGSLLSLATCVARQRRAEEAVELFSESIAMFRATLPDGHPTIARALVGKATTLLRSGHAAEAEPLLREADELRTAAFGDVAFDTLFTRYWRVRCLEVLGRLDEARPLLQQTLDLARTHHSDNGLRDALEQVHRSMQER